jgi:hypothetical protein
MESCGGALGFVRLDDGVVVMGADDGVFWEPESFGGQVF